MNAMSKFQRSWLLFKSSLLVILKNKKLLVFPIVIFSMTAVVAQAGTLAKFKQVRNSACCRPSRRQFHSKCFFRRDARKHDVVLPGRIERPSHV